MFVCLSLSFSTWNYKAPTGWISMKFSIRAFFQTSIQKIQVTLKSDKNNGYFTWRPIYIVDQISLSSA